MFVKDSSVLGAALFPEGTGTQVLSAQHGQRSELQGQLNGRQVAASGQGAGEELSGEALKAATLACGVLAELPTKVLLAICGYVDARSLCRLRQRCRYLNSVVDSHALWYRLHLRDFPMLSLASQERAKDSYKTVYTNDLLFRRIRKISICTEEGVTVARSPGPINSVFSPDGRRFLTIRNDGVRIHDLANSDPFSCPLVCSIPKPVASYQLSGTQFSPDGCWFVIGYSSWDHILSPDYGRWDQLFLCNLADGSFCKWQGMKPFSVTFSPDSRWLMTIDGSTHHLGKFCTRVDKYIGIHHLSDSSPLILQNLFKHPRLFHEKSQFSSDGRRFVSVIENQMHLWNLNEKGGELICTKEIEELNSSPLTQVQFSPDGRWLAIAVWKTLHIWDMNEQRYFTLEGHVEEIRRLMFSPDSCWVLTTTATGKSDPPRLWKLTDGSYQTLRDYEGAITFATFSSTGSRLATFSETQTQYQSCNNHIHVWDLASEPRLMKRVTQGTCRDLAFSFDGRWLVVDNQQVWNLTDNPEHFLHGYIGATHIRDSRWWLPRVEFAVLSPDARCLIVKSILMPNEIEVGNVPQNTSPVLDEKFLQALRRKYGTVVRCWNLVDGVSYYDLDSEYCEITVSPTGDSLLATHSDGSLHLLQFKAPE